MNTKRFLIVCFAVAVASISFASAQNDGAIVLRGDNTGWFQAHWNEEEGDASIISVNSSNSEFFCDGDGYDLWWTYRYLIRPTNVFNYHDHGFYFMRVFSATPDEYLSYENPCDFLNDFAPIAEGIVQATWFDNDETLAGKGANVWGHHYAGMVSTDLCESGMASFNLIRRWKILPSGEGRLQVNVGPMLDCE